MADELNILISSNDNYVMPLTVLLQSLFETQKQPMVFYFLCAELSYENRNFLNDYIRDNNSRLVFVSVPDNAFKALPTKKYISRETYFRLLSAELLPAAVSRALWLDADMVVRGDISDFYHLDLQKNAVAACPHGAVMKPTIYENCRNIGITFPDQYFNAGVMLCDLDCWREMDIPARIRDILSVPHEMMFPGQDLTNLIFNGHVLTEDWRVYNCMTHSILPEDMPELTQIARIIHFAGFAKPWNFTDLPFSDLWKGFFDRSPFRNTPLKRTSYRLMKKMYEKFRTQYPDNYENAQSGHFIMRAGGMEDPS